MGADQRIDNAMTNILTLDTSTDACSVAVCLQGDIQHRFELIPRQHNQRLFSMLREVLPAGELPAAGIEVLAYNHGPGSFTGLRIAASAMQGLAYSMGLPVVGVSTLACMAQGALRRGLVDQTSSVLVLLDARIKEVYWGLYSFEDGIATAQRPDAVSHPREVSLQGLSSTSKVIGLGNGLCYLPELPSDVRSALEVCENDCWPDSLDTLTLAVPEYMGGRVLTAEQVQPVYLRNEISWKKVHEQGR
jgi:tRNA threonylcarbamoyladenosine biosynthesis protein TsaB